MTRSADGGVAALFARREAPLAGLAAAKELGLLTIALAGGGGEIAASPDVDHLLLARSDDPRVVKEIHVTSHHLLWELVHIFLEQPGLLSPG